MTMTANEALRSGFDVKIGGRQIAEAEREALESIVVDRSWSAADHCVMTFHSYRPVGDASSLDLKQSVIGDAVEVTAYDDDDKGSVIFSGEISATAVHWRDGRETLVYEAMDIRHRLTRAINPVAYQKVSFKDIVTRIANEHRMKAAFPVSWSTTKFEQLVLTDSHFAILQHIAHRTGSVWTLDGTTLTFANIEKATSKGLELELGRELIEVDVRFTPIEEPDKIEVRGWDQTKGAAIVGTKSPKRPYETDVLTGLDQKLTTGVARSWSGGAVDATDAGEMADAIGRRISAGGYAGWGLAKSNPHIAPGTALEITGSNFANGTYVASAVRHRFDATGGVTEFELGSGHDHLIDLLGSPIHRAGAAPAGVTVGLVTQVSDEHKGLVRVKLPLISDEIETDWIRVASIGAGQERGITFLPEVNDEVLVAFEHGELNRPYVIGTLWNQTGKIFDKLVNGSNKIDERKLVSRIGHKIRLIDSEDNTQSGISIELDDPKTRIYLGPENLIIETEKRPLELKNGKASIKLENDEITISGAKITLNSTGDVAIDAKANATVKATQDVTLQATKNLSAKSNAGTTVESVAMTEIKGNPFVKING